MTTPRTSTRDRKRRVAGEDPHVLLPLLLRLAHGLVQNADGTYSGRMTYDKEEAPPLVRALMRIEAELLLEDARRLRAGDDVCRTPQQRRADALLLLLLRTAAALGQPVDIELLKRYKRGRHRNTPRGVSLCA